MSDLTDLFSRFRQQDRRALSRLLTFASRGQHSEAIRREVAKTNHRSNVVALTGSGGVGKSSLIGRLIEQAAAEGKSTAVLACDPESPLTGGALLGDRFRMPGMTDDNAPFIRSLAAASGQQALADHLDQMIAVLQAFGFDLIVLETVGAGQGDTAIRALVDVLVLLIQPESGDDLQWEKAGLMEVCDMVVVHKCDLPGAEKVALQVETQFHVPGQQEIPVLLVSANTKQGLNEFYEKIQTLASANSQRRQANHRDQLLKIVQAWTAQQFRDQSQTVAPIIDAWSAGKIDDDAATRQLLSQFSDDS